MSAAEPTADMMVRQGRSVRGHLAIFALALALPIVCLVGALFWRIAANERTRLEDDASEAARTIAFSIDREIAGLTSSLEVLSSSANLAAGDFEAFHRRAQQIAARRGIVPIVTDLSGQQLVNVRVPWGTALPKTKQPPDAAFLEAGRAFVSPLLRGALSGDLVFTIAMPVQRDGKTLYVLSFSLDLDRLRRILAEADLPPTWTASIVDRNGLIMARSTRNDEFVGRSATTDLLQNTTGRQGTWRGTTVDGADVFGAYARAHLADFRVAIGIRTADLNAPLWTSLSLFALIGAGIACLSTLLALFFGQRITAPIRALTRQAVALGRGDQVLPQPTPLVEANQVGAELVRAADSLRERQADLREANEELQRFAYIVSHDLRSPLVNIMGFTTELEALRDDVFARLSTLRGAGPGGSGLVAPASELSARAPQDEELARDFDEALVFIKASIGKMDRLINAVLRLSREGRRDFRHERVDMDALVQGIRDSMAHQAAAAGAEISVSRLPAVPSDRLALEQIFSNLLDNALKYLQPGRKGLIEVTGSATPAGLVYEVRDNGRGIDARDMERVFELFRRSGVQDRPGEGIGLAHVRTLVRRLGGNITLTSELGRGSTFTIALPRRWAGERKRETV